MTLKSEALKLKVTSWKYSYICYLHRDIFNLCIIMCIWQVNHLWFNTYRYKPPQFYIQRPSSINSGLSGKILLVQNPNISFRVFWTANVNSSVVCIHNIVFSFSKKLRFRQEQVLLVCLKIAGSTNRLIHPRMIWFLLVSPRLYIMGKFFHAQTWKTQCTKFCLLTCNFMGFNTLDGSSNLK